MQPLQIHDQILNHPQADYLILAGPTAVGKTDLVITLNEQVDIEVVSGDSRQIYKHMDIGTATPEPQILELFPHHLLNELNPDVIWNAAAFYQKARGLIEEIIARGNLPVVVGGAGLYLDALRFGLFDEHDKNPAVREKYQARVANGEAQQLWDELMQLDPDYAGTFHHHNHKKLIRSFEIYESTGMIPSEAFAATQDPFEQKDLFVVLDRDRKILYERVNQRALQMLDQGLLDECRELLRLGYSPDLYPMRTIGYKEIFAFLDGEVTHEGMVKRIQKNTRNFAKRQLTWFRNHPFDYWIDLGA